MSAAELVDALITARDVQQLIQKRVRLNESLALHSLVGSFAYFSRLKALVSLVSSQRFSRVSSVIQKLEKRSQLKCYNSNNALKGQRVLVIGGGISGLRVAIELLLLGAKVVVLEKRDSFSRNNVIHLWPHVIHDLRALGAKRFYGRFCVGSIDHIALRELQLLLLKISLLLGLEFQTNQEFTSLCPQLFKQKEECNRETCVCCCHRHEGLGEAVVAHIVHSETRESSVSLERRRFDVIIGADGRRNTLFQDFPRKEFRGKLAIAITANFVNKRSESEAKVKEISGVSYIYAQKWFSQLFSETGIQLENICYYRDETHYFVMTATKQSLLARRVLISDQNETHVLLAEENIDRNQLLLYARDAAHWTSGLQNLEFALNNQNSPDVALFDFTSVYASRNASRAKRVRLECCQKEKNFRHVLLLLTGDSLLEPFWPTGSGAGRGFLSALDAAYCCLRWNQVSRDQDEERMLDVIAERESIYRLLAQTTPDNVSCKDFSLLPITRYTNWRANAFLELREQVRHLVTDSKVDKRLRRATVAITSRDIKKADEKEEKEREESARREEEKKNEILSEKREEKGKRVKKEEIVSRAKDLESVLKEKPFSPQLAKVGKITSNDWNVKMWSEKRAREEKRRENSLPLNSREILESRKSQIESKLKDNCLKSRDLREKEEKNRKEKREWIQTLSRELSERMSENQSDTPVPSIPSSTMPQCVRCGLEVSAVERISVSGDVLHRSCLRCSKCGISLRLNEFRNELRFLCVFCIRNNSRSQNNVFDSLKAKEEFLKENPKIDFRERLHFENKTPKIEIIAKEPLNQNESSDSDSITLDVSSSSSSSEETTDDDSWTTTDSSDDSETTEVVQPPSIHVTTDLNDNPLKELQIESCVPMRYQGYQGSFTEKLFRSRSQPLLVRQSLKAFRTNAQQLEDHENGIEFADEESERELTHFSPLSLRSAPLIQFSDI